MKDFSFEVSLFLIADPSLQAPYSQSAKHANMVERFQFLDHIA